MFCNKFDIRKLLLYLNSTERGFILLQVNDRSYEQAIIDLLSAEQKAKVYNLFDVDFRTTVEESRQFSEMERIVYYGFHFYDDESLRELLEKINLSRDLLAHENKQIFFIVPRYIGRIIQQDYPNLYAYFVLKEEYIYKWEALFEYILPDSNYLYTKEASKEFRKHYLSSENEIETRLEYYAQRKAKTREYIQLEEDFEAYMDWLRNQGEEVDRRYFYSLMLKMGDVHTNQGNFDVAREFFDKIIKEGVVNAGYQNLYYEVLLHRADTYFRENRYEEAIKEYRALLEMLVIQHDYDRDAIFLEYSLKIYPRISICYARLEKYENADLYMLAADKTAKTMKLNDACFAIMYNKVLLAFHMGYIEDNQIEPLFDELEMYINCEIQEAMFYLVYAWYCGVLEGHCKYALRFVNAALIICRGILTENNTRIAECHYVNSILYMMMAEFEKSDICKKKCINILENYNIEEDRVQKVKEILEQ